MSDTYRIVPPTGPVTVEWIGAQVARIAGLVADDEVAHIEEDELHRIVLGHIATGNVIDAAACAAEALKTRDLDFARWCA